MKNFLFSLMMMALIVIGSSFSVDSINDDSNAIIKGVIFLLMIFGLYFLAELVNKKTEITTKNVYKKFKKMAKYLPTLENDQIRILNVYLGKADGEVMIFHPERVLEHPKLLENVDTFSAECILPSGSILYIYILKSGEMIDLVWDGNIKSNHLFGFTPEKMIQRDGTEIMISATP